MASRAETIRDRLPFSVIEQGDVILRSQIDITRPLNEHLVWLWGVLARQRRFLKNFQREGGKLVCRCRARGEVQLLPNGAEMLHLLSMPLIIEKG